MSEWKIGDCDDFGDWKSDWNSIDWKAVIPVQKPAPAPTLTTIIAKSEDLDPIVREQLGL